MSDRGVHPDLIEEVQASREAEQESAPAPEAASRETRGRRAGRTARQSAAPSSPPGATDVAEPAGEADGQGPPPAESPDGAPSPEWFSQAVRESTDPQTVLSAILKNVPLDELQKHPQISGWIGNMAQRVSREQAAKLAAEAAERERQDAWRRGDLYRLGELYSPEQQARAIAAQQAQASEPFMQSLTEFQKTLPDAVQQEVQGKQYASTADYMAAVHAAALKHDIDTRVDAELKKRQPALEKAELSATVGSEPSPERNGGPSPGVREITDAEIERMSLAEYDRYFDENGHARNGVRLRLTRGVDVTRR